jgi:hypothetical protein
MRASQLINRLEEILDREGDVEIELPNGTPLTKVTMVAAPRHLTAHEAGRVSKASGERPESPDVKPTGVVANNKTSALDRIRNAR